MYNLNKKQKIIVGIILAILAGVLCYYVYAREDSSVTQFDLEETIEENEKETEEIYSDDRILVHVSGAVNREGIVELKANSRIADAIEKARRNKRRSLYRGH